MQAFDEAWGKQDLDKLMEFMTDDCEYYSSVGQEPGSSYIGKEEVRNGFQAMFDNDKGSESCPGPIFVFGNIGVTHWSYISYNQDGVKTRTRGCDIFTFEGDKIKIKDAFRKCKP